MGVLTQKEYEKRNGAVPQKKKGDAPILTTEEELAPNLFEYVLFYPDNKANAYHNGTYRVVVGDKEKTYPIVKGIILVASTEEKSALEKKGFLFIERREVQE